MAEREREREREKIKEAGECFRVFYFFLCVYLNLFLFLLSSSYIAFQTQLYSRGSASLGRSRAGITVCQLPCPATFPHQISSTVCAVGEREKLR